MIMTTTMPLLMTILRYFLCLMLFSQIHNHLLCTFLFFLSLKKWFVFMFILFKDLVTHDQRFKGFWCVTSTVPFTQLLVELTTGFWTTVFCSLELFGAWSNEQVVRIPSKPQLHSQCWRLSNVRRSPQC